MDRKVKIALWNANDNLREQAQYLGEDYVLCMEYNDGDKINKSDFDYLVISYDDFRATKEKIYRNYGLPLDKIYTINEIRVLGCEEIINKRVHEKWTKLMKAEILPFEGKTVLITGGGSGIGFESAKAFLMLGAEVIICGRDINKLIEAQNRLDFPQISSVQWDVSNVRSNEKKLEEALLKSSRNRIDILVNCAGVLTAGGKTFFDVTEENWNDTMDTNLKGLYFICQTFTRYFMENRMHGRIVNVCSNTGLLPSVKPYGISKCGAISLTKGLGLHLAEYGITVNGIAPGEVATNMAKWHLGDVPARRNAQNGRVCFPCEVADMIVTLASPMSDNMPGEVIGFNGGDSFINIKL